MVNSFQEVGQSLFNNWNINLDEILFEQLDHYIAVKNYLMDEDEPSPDAENIEKVKGLLEAFYHLCEVGDWVNAENIFKIRLEITQKQELHSQLFTWGYYDENIYLCKRILNKLSPRINIVCYKTLADNMCILGRYNQAIEYCKKGSAIAKQIDEIDCKLSMDNLLGQIYNESKRERETIHLLKKSLEKNTNKHKTIDCRKDELGIYKTLGNAYFSLNQIQEAIHGYQISLNIAEEINDNQGIAGAYLEIANVYGFLGKFQRSEKYIRKAQTFVEASENYLDITNYKEKLGLVLCSQYKYSEGLPLLEKALERFDKIGYLKRIMVLSWNLSNAYSEIDQLQLARQHCKKALQIAKKLDIPLAQEYRELLSKIEEGENC